MDLVLDDGGRLFFGVVPDASTAVQACRLAGVLKHAHRFGREPIAQDCLHVSLLFLGELSQHLVRLACEAAADVRMPPFEMMFDRTTSFRGRQGSYPLVLVGDEALKRPMDSLRQALGAALTRQGLRVLAHGQFTPHLTLIYGEREVDERPVVPIGWTVNEFVLIHSLRGHAHVARWPLGV